MAEKKLGLARTIKSYELRNSSVIADGSTAQNFFAHFDAEQDIATLSNFINNLCAVVSVYNPDHPFLAIWENTKND